MQLDLLAAKGTVVAVGLLVLHAFVPFDPAVVTAPLVREDNTAARSALARASVEAKGLRFSEATFASNGVNCHAWVIAPPGGAGAALAPAVVMGHGFASQKDQGLVRYAEVFALRAGVASILVDYRTFGGSDGEPRHLVKPPHHAADLAAAVAWLRAGAGGGAPGVDARAGARVALWGSSMGGGHALVAAADLARASAPVSAVVAQAPMLDGLANSKFNVKSKGAAPVARLALAAARDLARDALGFDGCARVPVYAPAGGAHLGMMNLAPAELAAYYAKHVSGPSGMKLRPPPLHFRYYAKHPADGGYLGGWRNLACARVALQARRAKSEDRARRAPRRTRVLARSPLARSRVRARSRARAARSRPQLASYRPLLRVPELDATTPVLLVRPSHDSVVPNELIADAARAARHPRSRVFESSVGHFNLYDDGFEAASAAMADFLKDELFRKDE